MLSAEDPPRNDIISVEWSKNEFLSFIMVSPHRLSADTIKAPRRELFGSHNFFRGDVDAELRGESNSSAELVVGTTF